MANIIIKPADHKAWLEERNKGIGSSEVATILGVNPYETPYQLWRRKKGIDGKKEENFAMKAGHYLEDAVSRFFEDESGKEVIKSSAGDWLFINKHKQFLRVSPDRTFWLPGEKKNSRNWKAKGILECKTTQMTIDPEDLPKYWFCQLQYQLGVAEMEQGAIAWLTAGRDFGYRDINFVPDFYQWMTEEIEKFWVDHIISGKEPKLTSGEDVALKYRNHTAGKIAEATAEMAEAYEKLMSIKLDLKRLEEEKKELEHVLKCGFNDAETLEYCGKKLATWKSPKESMKFDEKAFKKDNEDIWKQYLIPKQGARRFLLK